LLNYRPDLHPFFLMPMDWCTPGAQVVSRSCASLYHWPGHICRHQSTAVIITIVNNIGLAAFGLNALFVN